MTRTGRILAALVLSIATSAAASGDDPAQMARGAANELAAAQLALSEADGARDRVAALTGVIRAYESGLMALREGLRRAAIRETALRRRFDADSARLSELLGVLMAIRAAPVPQLLLHPAGPLDTARAGMLLSHVTPALGAEAATLRGELEELAVLRSLQESAETALQDGLSGVQEARTRLSLAISSREELPRRFLADPEAIQGLIASSETLEGFASGLAGVTAGNGDGPVLPAFDTARGALPLPVTGRVLRHFSEPDAAGIRRPGLVIATPPGALVTTPWPATIRYRGPLLDYGNVMIVEPGGGYLLVLAGLDAVYGEIGEVLQAGAPLGLMRGYTPRDADFPADGDYAAGGDLSETLYMELRHDNRPVDPEPWFTSG